MGNLNSGCSYLITAVLLLAAAESDESEQHHQVQCGMLSETRASSLKIDVIN